MKIDAASASSSDDDLLRDYTRLRLDEGAHVIEVAVISWHGPHSPDLSWVEVVRVPTDTSVEELERIRRRLLERQRLFIVCKKCSKRHAKGHTDDGVCHGCMEKSGVVF